MDIGKAGMTKKEVTHNRKERRREKGKKKLLGGRERERERDRGEGDRDREREKSGVRIQGTETSRRCIS